MWTVVEVTSLHFPWLVLNPGGYAQAKFTTNFDACAWAAYQMAVDAAMDRLLVTAVQRKDW